MPRHYVSWAIEIAKAEKEMEGLFMSDPENLSGLLTAYSSTAHGPRYWAFGPRPVEAAQHYPEGHQSGEATSLLPIY